MEHFRKGIILVLGCLIFGLVGYHTAEGLQCYVCDDCVDGTELEAMQICGELPFESTSPATSTQSPTSRPTSPSPTQTGGSSSSSSSSSTISSSTRSSSTRSSSSTTVSTTRRPTTTTRRPTTKPDSDSDENYSDYEDSDEGDRRRHFSILSNSDKDKTLKEKSLQIHSNRQSEPVCYVVKFRVNNTRISSLGCTSMIQNNIYLTCLSLNRTGAVLENCELCGRNGCNKKIFLNETDDDYDYPWYSTGSRKSLEIVYCVLILVLLKLFN